MHVIKLNLPIYMAQPLIVLHTTSVHLANLYSWLQPCWALSSSTIVFQQFGNCWFTLGTCGRQSAEEGICVLHVNLTFDLCCMIDHCSVPTLHFPVHLFRASLLGCDSKVELSLWLRQKLVKLKCVGKKNKNPHVVHTGTRSTCTAFNLLITCH